MSRVRLRYFTLWLWIGWLIIAAVLYASLAPPAAPTHVHYNDKLGHFIAYFVLAGWFSQLYGRRARWWWTFAFVVMGVGLECLQILSATRIFELADMAANTVGALSGWALGSAAGGNLLARFELWLKRDRA